MKPANLEGRVKGICLDCKKPTERPHGAYYCFPCAKSRQYEAMAKGAAKVTASNREKKRELKKSLDDKGYSH